MRLKKANVIFMELGGDGRRRPSLTPGVINLEQIESGEQFWHSDLSQTCTRLVMKSGQVVEVNLLLDDLLGGEE